MNPSQRELKIEPGRIARQRSPIVLYTTDDGKVTVQVVFANETFWLTQKTVAELFGVQVPAISKHLKNIFKTNELVEDSVVSILETTASDGKNYSTSKYLKGRSEEDKKSNEERADD